MKANNRIIVYCFLVFVLINHSACNQETNPVLVAAVVKENVESYRQKRIKECQEQVLQRADAIVDSILLENAKYTILSQDSIIMPIKPDKPTRPNVQSPLDTTKVKPLFKRD